MLFVFSLLSFESSFYIVKTSTLPDMIGKYFPPFCSWNFHSLYCVLSRTKVLNFDAVKFIFFFLLWIILLETYLNSMSQRFSDVFLIRVLLLYSLVFSSVIHFTLIFVYGIRYRSRSFF